MDTTGSHQGRNPGPNDREEAMDRDTLETLCQSFAARQASGAGDADPVPEIVRSFRLAEISAAELQSLLGLVADDEDPADLDALHDDPNPDLKICRRQHRLLADSLELHARQHRLR